jgi:hypothetical protein
VKPRVEIMIDELVLHGFSPTERYAVGDSLSQELERLIMDQGFQAHGNLDIPSLRTAPVNLPQRSKPDLVGSRVAEAVYKGLPR